MGNKIGHNFYGHRVVPALGDNDVGVSFCRFDMLQMHRFQNPFVAFDNHFDRTSSFDNIPIDDSDKSVVGICIDEYFHIHHVSELFIAKNKNTFDDDYIARLDGYCLVGAGTCQERIYGLFDGVSRFQFFQMFYQ